jgi:hypothetical protein
MFGFEQRGERCNFLRFVPERLVVVHAVESCLLQQACFLSSLRPGCGALKELDFTVIPAPQALFVNHVKRGLSTPEHKRLFKRFPLSLSKHLLE